MCTTDTKGIGRGVGLKGSSSMCLRVRRTTCLFSHWIDAASHTHRVEWEAESVLASACLHNLKTVKHTDICSFPRKRQWREKKERKRRGKEGEKDEWGEVFVARSLIQSLFFLKNIRALETMCLRLECVSASGRNEKRKIRFLSNFDVNCRSIRSFFPCVMSFSHPAFDPLLLFMNERIEWMWVALSGCESRASRDMILLLLVKGWI